MEKKEFDAVGVVRKIRDIQYEEMKGKSVQEMVAYYREKSKAIEKRVTDLGKPILSSGQQ